MLQISLLGVLVAVLSHHVVAASNVTDICDLQEPGPWSTLLQEWATAPEPPGRTGRILSLLPSNGYMVTDRIDRPSLPPPRPPYDEWPRMTPPPPPHPGKIVNRPPNPYKDKVKPSYMPGKPGAPQKPAQHNPRPPVDRVDEPPRKEVSETDLYLLGAIEKLVYRADFMEKRLRKLEESLHYLVAGADRAPEPCVENYTRVGGSCYHYSQELYDWKTANLACRKLRGHLLELEGEQERRQLLAALLADQRHKGSDFWTGGLNPGLLWIWSNSAKPIEGNTTATQGNSTHPSPSHIYGEGRCLGITYDPAVRSYVYRGQDCAFRHRFICEKTEDKAKLSNEIERIAKKMRLDGNSRKAKIMWNNDS